MRLLIVRHGQTDENLGGVIQTADVKLNAVGNAQAQHVAEKLRGEHIDVAYVSDYVRTKETAAAILAYHPETKVIDSPELREKDAGVFMGHPKSEQQAAREKSGATFYAFRPEGGESLVDLQTRIVAFYEKITKPVEDKTLLFVTHNGTIKTLLLHLMDKSFADWKSIFIANTEVIEIDTTHSDHYNTLFVPTESPGAAERADGL